MSSFPRAFRTYLPAPRTQPAFPLPQPPCSSLAFGVLLPVYRAKPQPWLQRSGLARKKLYPVKGFRRICSAQSPEVRQSHPFSRHFSHPEDLAQSPTPDKHPPSCLQVFKESDVPPPARGSYFLPRRKTQIKSETCGAGLCLRQAEKNLVTPSPVPPMAFSVTITIPYNRL